MRCPTGSGPYQCKSEDGHDGPCEAQAPEYDAAREIRKLLELHANRIECHERTIASLQFDSHHSETRRLDMLAEQVAKLQAEIARVESRIESSRK